VQSIREKRELNRRRIESESESEEDKGGMENGEENTLFR